MAVCYSTELSSTNLSVNEFIMPQGPDYNFVPCTTERWNIDILRTQDFEYFPTDHSKWFVQVVRDCYKDGMILTPSTDPSLYINTIGELESDEYGVSIDINFNPAQTERLGSYQYVKIIVGWGDNEERYYFFWQNLVRHVNSI